MRFPIEILHTCQILDKRFMGRVDSGELRGILLSKFQLFAQFLYGLLCGGVCRDGAERLRVAVRELDRKAREKYPEASSEKALSSFVALFSRQNSATSKISQQFRQHSP